MAAPSVRAFTTNRVATTSLSLNKPTGTASGDLLVAILFPVGPPTTEKTVTPGDGGFSEVTAAHSPIDDGSWRGDLRIYVKAATGSEGSSYSFTASSADHFAGIMVAVQGADTAATINGVVNVIEDQASLILSGLSTDADDSLILVAQIGWDAAGDAATPTATGLTFTEHFDDAGNDIAFATAEQATAGATGNITITALDFRFCALAIAIAPDTGPPPQFARPDGDESTGSWTATTLFSKVDESSADDGDFITSASGPSNDTCELSLSDVTDPVSSSGHILRVRRKKSASSGNQIDMRYRLLQGASEIAAWTDDTNISESAFSTIERTLDGTQTDSITNYTDLRVEIRANQNTQAPSAPTFTAAGTAANTATASTGISPGLPASFQANDIFIMVAHHSSNTDFNDPSGWTRITALTGNNTSAQRVVAWWRRAQVGDTAPSVTASTSTAVRIARIYGFRGCITTGDPWDSSAGPTRSPNAASASISSTSITTAVANCIVAFFGAYEDDPTTASQPGGYAPIGVSGTTTGNDAMLCGFYKQISGTSTENPSTTVSGGTFTNSVNTGLMIALKPEPFPDIAAQVSWVEFQVPGAVGGGPTTLNFTGTITPAGALLKTVNKPYTSSITPAGALRKTTTKPFTGTITPSGLLTVLRTILLSFTATITPTGALTSIKAILRSFTATITPAGTLARTVAKGFTATVTPSGAFAKAASFLRGFSAAVTPSGSLRKLIAKPFTATITPSGAFNAFKVIVRSFTATISVTGAFTKINIKTFVASITPVGSFTRVASLFRTHTATISPSGALFKTIFKSFSGVIDVVGSFLGGLFGVADRVNVKVGDRLKTKVEVADSVKTSVAVSDRMKTSTTVSDELGN